MPFKDLLVLARAIIDSIQAYNPEQNSQLFDDTFQKLSYVFPENLIIGALDLLDRGNVIHYETPWGYSEYEVLGSTDRYSVFVDLHASRIPYSCTCSAFMEFVLLSETHIMCKHILATLLGRKLELCIERPASADDLAAMYCHRYPLPTREMDNISTDVALGQN